MKQLPTRKQVIQTLFETWQLKDQTEQIPTADALNRVLVKDYKALYSFPVVRSSAMDGVAVISERFKDKIPDTSGWKSGVDFCRADTGDDFDDAFDAVITIEDVTFADDGYYLKRKPLRGGSLPDVLGASAFYTTELGTNLKKAGETLEVTLLRGEEEL